MTWEYGDETAKRAAQCRLTQAGWSDVEELPMPAEHTGNQRLWVYEVDGITTMCKSETEWIKGKTWGEL